LWLGGTTCAGVTGMLARALGQGESPASTATGRPGGSLRGGRGGEQRQPGRVGAGCPLGLDGVVLDAHEGTSLRSWVLLAIRFRAASSRCRRLATSLLEPSRRTCAPAENAAAAFGSQSTDARTGDRPPHTWARTLPTSASL